MVIEKGLEVIGHQWWLLGRFQGSLRMFYVLLMEEVVEIPQVLFPLGGSGVLFGCSRASVGGSNVPL